jgi:hypothetical protein
LVVFKNNGFACSVDGITGDTFKKRDGFIRSRLDLSSGKKGKQNEDQKDFMHNYLGVLIIHKNNGS